MHLQLLAIPTAGGEKAAEDEHRTRHCCLQKLRCSSQGDHPDLTLNAAWATRLDLFRLVSDKPLDNGHTCRRKPHRLTLDENPAQFDAVRQSRDDQAAGCAADSTCDGSRSSSSDLDFSSFIIGDGALTARFVRIVK